MAEQDIPPPTITVMKIPIIRKGEYDIWSIRMRQYICHTDHNLWDVIVNGNLEEKPTPTRETSAPPALKTAKQLAARRNQERVKSILLLAIPDEYLLKFIHSEMCKMLNLSRRQSNQGLEEMKNPRRCRKIEISQSLMRLILDDLYTTLVYEDEMKRSSVPLLLLEKLGIVFP
ncbi:hypothetical protein Tco_1078561 [Tanacetum coccineum]|uniref:DUF4219 domain-containing protein n=1 Tax=Tanacetum coccineum TaxID=301880 RepID=A0ABQ5HPD2_9ASTR